MYAIEFKTIIKDGIIKIPEKYRKIFEENVKVIVLAEEKMKKKSEIIEDLFKSPLKISNFKPMNRDEIYERT